MLEETIERWSTWSCARASRCYSSAAPIADRTEKRESNEMPTVQADRLMKIGVALLRAAGASSEEAEAVAGGCVEANLVGHDSHGIVAVPTYIDRIKAGHIVPGAPFTIVQESPTTTAIDGHWGSASTSTGRRCSSPSRRRRRATSPPSRCFARVMSVGSAPTP